MADENETPPAEGAVHLKHYLNPKLKEVYHTSKEREKWLSLESPSEIRKAVRIAKDPYIKEKLIEKYHALRANTKLKWLKNQGR